MVNRIYETAMGIARGTALAIGVAVMLAMLLGVATTALAGTGVGARFQLGKVNTVNAITKLVASVAGPSLQIDNNSTNTGATALDLQVEPGKAPMKVNSASKVANLNADRLDGKSANEIGLNGLERVAAVSASDSNGVKGVEVFCPAGKVLVTTGYAFEGGLTGDYPNIETDVVIREIFLGDDYFHLTAMEEKPISTDWRVNAVASCATAP